MPRPAEERSYLWFMASALSLTLVAGLTLPFLIVAGDNGVAPWAQRLEALRQAHGAVQLQGWAGLVVAGMGLRLVPRFAGRRPLPSPITVTVVVLMVVGIVSRSVGQAVAPVGLASAFLVAGVLVGGGGMLLFAIATAVTLIQGRAVRPWGMAIWAGCLWWLAWALVGLRAATLSSSTDVPNQLVQATNWLALLGAIGNFIWAVQCRSVPIFYGRRPPKATTFGLALALYNAGLVTLIVGMLSNHAELEAIGLVGLGLGTSRLAPIAGALRGKALRLRPASQPLSRFIIAANRWAAGAGVLMVTAGLVGMVSVLPPPAGLLDAAYHALALGTVTVLIVGMAQLINPVFAIQRAGRLGRTTAQRIIFTALMIGAALRVLAGAGMPMLPLTVWSILIPLSGLLAWVGLAAFALTMSRAWIRQADLKAQLASAAREKFRPQD